MTEMQYACIENKLDSILDVLNSIFKIILRKYGTQYDIADYIRSEHMP